MSERRGAHTVASLPLDLDLTIGQKPDEHCAVVGIIGKEQVFHNIIISLKALQHRGQESAGIATFDGSSMNLKKGMGLVGDVFQERDGMSTQPLAGSTGIGHTRYSTQGSKSLENAGPFVISSSVGYVALSHNGEITNQDRLREELKKKGSSFVTSSDTEVMLVEIAKDVAEFGMPRGIRYAMGRLNGAYAAAILINDRLFALRDPYGIRPLILGEFDGFYIIASESCAIDSLGGRVIRDVRPGELVEMTTSGPVSHFVYPARRTAHCMFEYVYFARPDSTIDGKEVFEVRKKIGEKLAEEYPVEADVVIPVPDSGRAQALGYSHRSGIPYDEGLIKNRYSQRTFIMPSQKSREAAVKIKLNPIRSVVEGKKVVLVDDSIVRGNTIKHIVSILRKAGATQIHVRIGCPPILSPCYFGVDMKTKDQFLASGKTVEEIRREIGADTLGYISIKNLTRSIEFSKDQLCIGCLNGSYPTYVQGKGYELQAALEGY
ncbi:MAG: amidophosphoribosyltransferase [Candidatus Thermoplasmatota archaeon]|nr:amidophosphoribosyltransferase [Candidatus Thermoplasmatota archaeon]